MPPKKNIQEQTDAFPGVLDEFQVELRESLQASMEAAFRTVFQARPQPQDLPRQGAPIFREEEQEVGLDDNPFAGLHEQELRQQHPADIVVRDGENRRWEAGFKVDLPDFHGTMKAEELLDWISTTEELFTFKGVLENMRVPLVATRFRGQASAWWRRVKEHRIHAGKNRIDSWDSLKHKLRKAFLPYNYERTIYNRFQNLRQGTRSVDEYAAEFFSFLAPSSVQETNDQLVYQFIGGLRQQIPKTLLQINLSTDSEAHQHALLIELNNRSSQSSWFAGVS